MADKGNERPANIARLKGPIAFETLWDYLKDETDRGFGVVIGCHLDGKLGELLQTKGGRFHTRINRARKANLITQNEHDDLHVIRRLRNSFAHTLEAKTFDADKVKAVNSLKTWQLKVESMPKYDELLPDARSRLLYVFGCFHIRFLKGRKRQADPLPEPELWWADWWIPVTSF